MPWVWARLILKPADVYQLPGDARVEQLRFWRRFAWFLAFVLFATRFNPGALTRVPAFAVYSAAANAVVAVVVVIAACVFSVVLPEASVRLLAWRAIMRPLVRLALIGGVVGVLVWTDLLWIRDGYLGPPPMVIDPVKDDRLWPVLLAFTWSIWLLVLLASFVWYVAKYLLAVRDAHPVLEPVCTVAVAWVVFLANEIDFVRDIVHVVPDEPPLFAETPSKMLFSVLTVVSLTVLCAWEVKRMGGFGLLRSRWA